jgi:hypothetical protein
VGRSRHGPETRAAGRMRRWARACGTSACLCLCNGCGPSLNTYATPRTVPGPKLEHTVAAEGFFDLKHRRRGLQETFPLPTVYALRFGYLDRADFGVRVVSPGSVVLDTKWNFLRSRIFDAAIDPGFACELGFETGRIWWHLPLMMGINLQEQMSVVLVQGVSRMYSFRHVDYVDIEIFRDDDLYYRAGLGLDLRIADHFALHPEATLMHPIASSEEVTLPLQLGMALNMGGLPVFP